MMPETSGGRLCDPSKAPAQTETGTRGGEREPVTLNEHERSALREFERAMRDEVIPAIDRVMKQRARDAQRSRECLIW